MYKTNFYKTSAYCIAFIFQSCKEDDPTEQPPVQYPFSVNDFGLKILSDGLVGNSTQVEYRVINYADTAYTVDQDANGGFFRIRFSVVTKDNMTYGKHETIPFITAKDTILKTISISVEGKEYFDLTGRVEFVKK